MLLKLIQTTFVLLGSLAANADPHWRCISMAHKGHPQMGVSIMVNDIYIYTYAWGPRFPQIILLIIDPNVKNHCFATAKCGFCTFFFFIL